MNKDKIIKDLKLRNDLLVNQRQQFEIFFYNEQLKTKRLNNFINELEKFVDTYELGKYDYKIPLFILKDKLKELKIKYFK